jgi:hypothetical protein
MTRARPPGFALVYPSVEKCHRGIFQPRPVQSIAPHGSHYNDWRRHFGIASVR